MSKDSTWKRPELMSTLMQDIIIEYLSIHGSWAVDDSILWWTMYIIYKHIVIIDKYED